MSTSGKDAFNAVGVGAFFNLMNFGQMFMWHIVLVPIILVAIVGAHVLLVRVRGVSHPIDAHPAAGAAGGSRRLRRRAGAPADAPPPPRRTRRHANLQGGTSPSGANLALSFGPA